MNKIVVGILKSIKNSGVFYNDHPFWGRVYWGHNDDYIQSSEIKKNGIFVHFFWNSEEQMVISGKEVEAYLDWCANVFRKIDNYKKEGIKLIKKKYYTPEKLKENFLSSDMTEADFENLFEIYTVNFYGYENFSIDYYHEEAFTDWVFRLNVKDEKLKLEELEDY